jgi:hypothetical protein
MDELEKHEAAFSRMLSQAPSDDQGRTKHRDALRARVLAAFDTAGQPAPVAWKRILNHGRELMRRPVPRFMAAAAASLLAVAVWSLFPDRQSTAHAFNMFAVVLAEANSATFEMDLKVEEMPDQKMHCYYLAPGRFRYEFKVLGIESVNIMDRTVGKTLALIPAQKKAKITNLPNLPGDANKAESGDIFKQMRDLLSKPRDPKDAFKPIGKKKIDGIEALGFRCSLPDISFTLWGDPTTGLPVLVGLKSTGRVQMESTMSHFKFNEALKPELFDMAPPEGYTVETVTHDSSRPTEAMLVEALGTYADVNEGQFPDDLDWKNLLAPQKRALRNLQAPLEGAAEQPDDSKDAPARLAPAKDMDARQAKLKESMTSILRGMQFAWNLPESSVARYAGKGVNVGEPDRPIFWYKPAEGETYRVIYADLTVKEVPGAPEVAGAVPVRQPTMKEMHAVAEADMAETNAEAERIMAAHKAKMAKIMADAQAKMKATIAENQARLKSRPAPQDQVAMKRLQTIAGAIQAERDANHGLFPTDILDASGKPLLSWRVRLLPYFGDERWTKLYEEFHLDEPWDSEHNIKVARPTPLCYMTAGVRAGIDKTVFVTPSGTATIFDGVHRLGPKQISDGLGETILLVVTDIEHAVVWTKPEDLYINAEDPAAGLHYEHEFFLVARADGSVARLPADIEPATLWSFFTRAGGEKIPWPAKIDR